LSCINEIQCKCNFILIFKNVNALIICNIVTINYSNVLSGAQNVLGGSAYGNGKWTDSDILMDDVDCKGHEGSLHECTYSPIHNCQVHEAASVQCWQNRGMIKDYWYTGIGKTHRYIFVNN